MDTQIQGNVSLKNAATFDQRKVPYFDFQQQPIASDSVRSLLHLIEEQNGAKSKKRKSDAPTACQKSA